MQIQSGRTVPLNNLSDNFFFLSKKQYFPIIIGAASLFITWLQICFRAFLTLYVNTENMLYEFYRTWRIPGRQYRTGTTVYNRIQEMSSI